VNTFELSAAVSFWSPVLMEIESTVSGQLTLVELIEVQPDPAVNVAAVSVSSSTDPVSETLTLFVTELSAVYVMTFELTLTLAANELAEHANRAVTAVAKANANFARLPRV
jgi:chaperone required for assembly of F1-ATPase